jgi:hypothetical protein
VSGNFPPLVPSHFLKTQEDARKNAGPSFSSIAAKGVKPGAKIMLRSPSSLLPSWSETWMKNEDWVLVPPGQEDLLQRGLGSGFRVQFAGGLWEGICEVDEMAPRNGASGDFRLGLVERWLKEQALIRELVDCSVYPPEYIELIGASGQVNKMYRLVSRKQKPATPPKKRSPAPPSPPKLVPSSSSKFPTRKDKGKGKARDIYISESERKKLQIKLDQYKELHRNPNSLMEKPLSTSEEDEFIKKLASEVTDQIRGVMSFTETPKLDYVINQALAGDTWYSKPDNDDTIAEDWFKGLINDLSDVEPAKKNQPTKADKLVKSKPGLPQSWDSVQGSILANHDMADLSISVIMPILQEEWQRRQARRGEQKSSHLARGGMHGAPQRQHWQGNQNNSGYTPQAGPSNYNSGYKPAPYKKFGKKPNYKPNNQNPGYNSNVSGSKGPNGPNWERNRQNHQNKKQARMLLKEQVAKLESQSKPDTKGKKKEKAGKSANLLA